MNRKNNKRVYVGVSGGVDSSVALYLLKKQGYDVTGVFIKTWHPDWLPCTEPEDRLSAIKVCAELEVPFLELDAKEEYKRGVADRMIADYKAGRTPNPDVLCNREVKFGIFYKWAKEQGADFVATGHYARSEDGKLLMGKDSSKDQSYFLWMIDTDILPNVLFPIGNLEKKGVRKIAERAGLHTFKRKDSQGVCFLGDIDIKDFLSHYIEKKTGNVIVEGGQVVGEHDGINFYTVGERHGFRILPEYNTGEPFYITKKDVANNVLYVSKQNPLISSDNKLSAFYLEEVNFFSKNLPDKFEGLCRVRHLGELHKATVTKEGDKFKVELKDSESISPGQSAVIYMGDELILGGIISSL
ncbi:MAG: tRNA 2-thiouridine(34) synthase MnmA [Candidatus Pacebacteria bacterium]|nr:tRNA 2-thiouridine(34) synthase MnmA [Candidatus Paceibacterota bacterium]MBP9058125.1 tRNA 2-thiouridine(34) synthase MnmA [Candidatus Paceibacterota bacterium]MBP9770107.1 tRNA 2-thiouridine(34) synthase MnmA [Candidatus Paceibacterota bacterium]